MEKPASRPSQTIGSLTQDIVKNASASAMTSTHSATNSEIMPSPRLPSMRTGTQLSTTGLPTLRALAEQAITGAAVITDQNLQALLTSRWGSQLDIRARTSFGTEENPDFQIKGYQVTLTDSQRSDKNAIEYLEAMNRPARAEFIAGKLARLRVTMARRNESEKDISLLMDTMADLCREYPADAVADATAYWMKTEKFFPLPKDLLTLLDERVMLRRAVLAAIQGEKPRQLAAPDYSDWKQLPRERWDVSMWQAYVQDAQAMVDLAKQNPSFLSEATWLAEVEKRKAQIPAAMAPPVNGLDASAGGMAPAEQNAPPAP